MFIPFAVRKLNFVYKHARAMSSAELVELYADQLNANDLFEDTLIYKDYEYLDSLITSLKNGTIALQHYTVTKKETELVRSLIADAIIDAGITCKQWTAPVVLCRIPRNVVKGQNNALCYLIFQKFVEDTRPTVAATQTPLVATTQTPPPEQSVYDELADVKARLADTEAALKEATDRQIAVAAAVALMHEHQKKTDAQLQNLINFLGTIKVVDKVVLSAYQHTTTLLENKAAATPAAATAAEPQQEQQPYTIEEKRITPNCGENPAQLNDIVSFNSNSTQKFGVITHISDSGKTLTYLPLKKQTENTFKTVKYIDTTTNNDLQCVTRNIYRVLNATISE